MKPYEQLLQENNDLQDRLNVAEDTLRAIRMDEVDALTVCTAQGDPVNTLQNADQPYRSLVEQMQQGAVTISDDGSVLYCNRYFATLVGHSPEFIVSQNISQFIVAEEQAQFTAFIQTAHANEGIYQEFHCQNCQSQAIAVYIVANVFQLVPRVVICLIVTDLSESKHFQQLLRQSEDRYHTVINAMPDGLVLFSNDGTIQSCNPAAERIVGLTVDQMRGLTPIDPRWDAINEDGSPCPGEMHPSSITLKTGKAVSNAVIGTHRPDGNIFWSLVNSQPIFGADGQSLEAVVVSFADITNLHQAEVEFRQSEAALRNSQRQLRIIIDSLPHLVSYIDKELRYQFVNKEYQVRFGLDSDQIIGKPVATITGQAAFDSVRQEIETAFSGSPVEYEREILYATNPRFTHTQLLPHIDDDGNVAGIIAMVEDITVRRRTSEAIAHLAAIVTSSVDAIVSETLAGIITSWNQGAERLFGYMADEAVGRSVNFLLPPEKIDEEATFLDKIAAGETIHQYDTIRLKKDGSQIFVSITLSPIKDALGNVVEASKIEHDISERKQAEEKLHRYSQRLESTNRLARAMTSDLNLNRFYDSFVNELRALMPIDRTGIIMLNKTADQWQVIRQWTNYQPVFVLGEWHPVRGSVIEQIVASASPFLEDELDVDELWPESAILRREGIRSRYLQPLIIHGQVVGLLSVSSRQPAAFSADDRAIVNSIADQLTNALFSARLYDEVQRYASELEQRVGERTAQLEAANKELEAFSYSVSHDLRAPLRTVDGFSRILLRDYAAQLPETAQQQLQRVRDGAQQMGKLIDDLLAFSRTGRHAINKQNVSLRDIVHSVLNELKSEHENRQVEITVGELPTLEADPVLLKQVFFNLIANALKFTGRCAVARIEIGCTQIDGGKVIYVKDNGAGFDMAYADKLFGVFQRLHSTEEFPGTGVGLAIVQRIIHRHGGRIWAMAEVDKGATFYFTLKEGAPHE